VTLGPGVAPFWLDPGDPDTPFPDVALALREPDGLLAVGGDLSVARLLRAYRQGIFPWYGEGQPILWWSPDPRLVILPESLHISRSLARQLKKKTYTVTLDRDFDGVIEECAAPRAGQKGTWITGGMVESYGRLHAEGHTHSVECWYQGRLVGGLYGVAIGRIFFGESMFSTMSDASKVAFVLLVRQLERWGFPLIDCQVHTSHLASLGAAMMPRQQFTRILDQACSLPPIPSPWTLDDDLESA